MCAPPSPRAICRRLVFKLQKTVCVVFIYLVFYLLLSYAVTPDSPSVFVADDVRIGGKHVLMFLASHPSAPVYTDAEGADVFATRRCGNCFLTNNKGFLPMTEYDAVLVHGKRSLLSETAAFMEPGKRYLIETSERCIRSKLKCPREPTVTSFSTRMEFTLCNLCDKLIHDKQKGIFN